VFHQDIEDIEKSLLFLPANEVDNDNSIIFSDTRYGEKICVLPNESAIEGSADIEILFKAVIEDAALINSCFNN
jgi:hypothetical protein